MWLYFLRKKTFLQRLDSKFFFPIHFAWKLSTFDTMACKFLTATYKDVLRSMLSRYIYSAIILQHTAFGVFLLVWSIQGIITMLFCWHSKSHGNFHIRFLVEVPMFPNFVISVFTYRAVFKWLSKNQNQSNYSDQSQQEQTARSTNHNS